MIEGLKVVIKGDELQVLCEARAAHHDKRADVCARQVESMRANKVEGMDYSSGDPEKELAGRLEGHAQEASELRFIATHLDLQETYLLARADLHKLGITATHY